MAMEETAEEKEAWDCVCRKCHFVFLRVIGPPCYSRKNCGRACPCEALAAVKCAGHLALGLDRRTWSSESSASQMPAEYLNSGNQTEIVPARVGCFHTLHYRAVISAIPPMSVSMLYGTGKESAILESMSSD